MKTQRGSTLVAVLVTLGIVGVIVGTLAVSYVTNYNYGNRAEKEIIASWEQNENVLAQYSLKVSEMAQVPAMYKDDVKEVYTAAITGRYGENGSQAMMQWLKEQNPNLDPSLYKSIQDTMAAGRDKFENSQKVLVDLKRGYETNQGYLWKGFWLRVAGYPTIDLDEYKIITSDYASEAFETGVDKGIKIR